MLPGVNQGFHGVLGLTKNRAPLRPVCRSDREIEILVFFIFVLKIDIEIEILFHVILELKLDFDISFFQLVPRATARWPSLDSMKRIGSDRRLFGKTILGAVFEVDGLAVTPGSITALYQCWPIRRSNTANGDTDGKGPSIKPSSHGSPTSSNVGGGPSMMVIFSGSVMPSSQCEP